MKRLLILLLLLCGQAWGQVTSSETDSGVKTWDFGWKYQPEESQRVAEKLAFYSAQVNSLPFRDDVTSLNYAFLCKAMGAKTLPTLDQGNVGACVGFATCRAAGITAAADIFHRREQETWVADFSPEALYAIGREVAGQLGSWDGSTGAWSVEGLQKIGTLHRLVYEPAGAEKVSLLLYEPARAKAWAARGVPQQLKPIAGEHRFLAAALVETVEKAKASLQNGYPLITCSMMSYGNVRDQDGFLRSSGRNWAHAMVVAAYRAANTGREGYLILNSWRAVSHDNGWVTGPIWPAEDQPYPQPIGSFWISPADLLEHLKYGDTWAISGYQGFVGKELAWEEVFSQAGGKTRD